MRPLDDLDDHAVEIGTRNHLTANVNMHILGGVGRDILRSADRPTGNVAD